MSHGDLGGVASRHMHRSMPYVNMPYEDRGSSSLCAYYRAEYTRNVGATRSAWGTWTPNMKHNRGFGSSRYGDPGKEAVRAIAPALMTLP
eukprot:scaffold248471_cov36-Tisochrysis_lutea.AAC.1